MTLQGDPSSLVPVANTGSVYEAEIAAGDRIKVFVAAGPLAVRGDLLTIEGSLAGVEVAIVVLAGVVRGLARVVGSGVVASLVVAARRGNKGQAQ